MQKVGFDYGSRPVRELPVTRRKHGGFPRYLDFLHDKPLASHNSALLGQKL